MREVLGGFGIAIAICLLAAGCAHESSTSPLPENTTTQIATPTAMLANAERRACGTAVNGADFRNDLPHPGVAAADGNAHFTPRWQIGADKAYAIYQLAAADSGEALQLDLDWAIAPETATGFSALWVGIANWRLSTWNWHQGYDPAHVVETHAPDCLADGQATVLVMITGYAEAELAGLELLVSTTGDWWMFGHDRQHTGRSHYAGPQTPTLKWTYTFTNEVYGSPVVNGDGVVYCASDNGEIVAIKPDGANYWAECVNVVDYLRSGSALDAQGGLVYGDWGGQVNALSTVDGSPAWTAPFATGDTIVSSPLIMPDGSIYIGSHDGGLYKLDSNGQPAWAAPFMTGGRVLSSPAAGPDGTIYFGSDDGCLYALNPDGTELWPEPFATEDFIDSAPAVSKYGVIYFGGYDGNIYALNPDGRPAWPRPFATGGWVTASPSIGPDGTVYAGSWDGNLYAIKPDGYAKWTAPFATGGPIEGAAAIGADGVVYFGSHDGNLYALKDDGTAASELWRYSTGGPVHQGPVLDASGTLYVGSADYRLYALADSGTEYTWRTELVDAGTAGADVGRYSRLVLNVDDQPEIAYYDTTNGDLCYATGGDGWAVETAVAENDVGSHASLAIDTDGTRHIAHYDLTNTDQRHAWWDGSWHDEYVFGEDRDAGLYGTMFLRRIAGPTIRFVGREPDKMYHALDKDTYWLTFTDDDEPLDCLTCLYDGDEIPYACGYLAGSSNAWLRYRRSAIDYSRELGIVGTVSGEARLGLAMLGDQRAGITYYAHDDGAGNPLGDLLFSEWDDGPVTNMVIDTDGDVGRYSSIARGEHGYPQVAYYDATNDALKYARYNGLAWDVMTIADNGGEYCSLAIDANWLPHISYYAREVGNLRYATLIAD